MSRYVTDDLLESVVRKLGPIKSADALLAFAPGYVRHGGFEDCALALAYGAPSELSQRLGTRGPDALADATGLSAEEARAIHVAYDYGPHAPWMGDGNADHPKYVLLRSLLEAEAAKLGTVPSLAIRACTE